MKNNSQETILHSFLVRYKECIAIINQMGYNKKQMWIRYLEALQLDKTKEKNISTGVFEKRALYEEM